jgi:dipeptidyl aminopeptidase/acylaminoacyl peptidase
MTERELREALRRVPVDEDARGRALQIARAAYREREPVRPRRRVAPALALAACVLAAVVVAASLNAPGDAVARWVRDVLGTGHPDPKPALVRVPGGGRLLVSSADGAWAVAADGSRRRLGDYSGVSWSPRGLFVVGWRGGELVAMEPSGRVHWSLARPRRITAARWAPGDGYRVAYLSGRTLRIVNGDGTGDRALAAAAPVAPSWRGGDAYVLAFADRYGRVHAVNVDTGVELWRERPGRVRRLAWSPDGRRLAVVTRRRVLVLGRNGAPLHSRAVPRGAVVDDVSWSSGGRLAVVRRGAHTSEIVVDGRAVFTGSGRFGAVAWSPSGRRLLVPWPAADQWLFLDVDSGRASAVANIARQFARGPARQAFPDTVEWCCS